MGPLILRVDFHLARWRVQAAFGMAVQRTAVVEGELVLEGAPRLRPSGTTDSES